MVIAGGTVLLQTFRDDCTGIERPVWLERAITGGHSRAARSGERFFSPSLFGRNIFK